MKKVKISAVLLIAAMLLSISGCRRIFPRKESTKEQSFHFENTDKNCHGIKSVDIDLESKERFIANINFDDIEDLPGAVGRAMSPFWYPADKEKYFSREKPLPQPDKVLLTVNYDEDGLFGIPEENLILLVGTDDGYGPSYDPVKGIILDIDQDQIVADITGLNETGGYILADAYEWYKSRGMDASANGYKKPADPAKVSDWEKKRDTGSIMELVDREWMEANAPVFHVSTPAHLASVVYYVNSQMPSYEIYAEIYLENDIDLTGYDWKPIGWGSRDEMHGFKGKVDGRGHSIKGLKIEDKMEDSGFISYSKSIEMKDITFTDADIKSVKGAGICAGQTIGHGVWENVHASGNISISEGANNGGLTGWVTDIVFKNCSAEFTVNNGVEKYHYLSYQEKRRSEIGPREDVKLWINEDRSVSCEVDRRKNYRNLMFHVEQGGQTILEREPSSENGNIYTLSLGPDRHGKFTVYMVAFIDGVYVRVSNVVELTVE